MTKVNNTPANSSDVRDRTWLSRRLGRTLLLSEADRLLLQALWPRCVRCDKRVDNMTSAIDPSNTVFVVFTASCHGQTENTRVHFQDFPKIMAYGVQGAEAFTGPITLKCDDPAPPITGKSLKLV